MLIVFLGSGDQKIDGRNCYAWPGLPPIEDVVRRVGNEVFDGLRIQIEGLMLPNERINTYTSHELYGSYDGHTLIVAAPRIKREPNETPEAAMQRTYFAINALFFEIVFGDIGGNYRNDSDLG